MKIGLVTFYHIHHYGALLQACATERAVEALGGQCEIIDYYVNIMQGRSMQALTLSYAACLYTKKMPNLLMRTDAMRNQSLPAAVEQAVALEGLKNERLLRHYPRLNPLNVERTKAFLETMQYYYQGDRLQAYDKLKENWAGFYPLYYFLENIPDDKLKPQHEGYQAEKGGVN